MTVLATVAWLILHHCAPPGAAGIAANLEVESRLNPRASSRSGLGLAQWAGRRRAGLQAALGANLYRAEAQLGYLLGELRALGLWREVCEARSPGSAAAVFMLRYERPNHRSTTRRARRAGIIYGEYLLHAQ